MASVQTARAQAPWTQGRTRDGATVGGVAGAIIGGIIGHQNDETPEGVIIGGAVGAVAGGLLGKAQDNELARQRNLQQQAYFEQQQQNLARQQALASTGVSNLDLVNMVRSGLSESLIISQLTSRGVQRRLEVSEIIALHQQGVSDSLISAMQQAPLATQLAPAPYANQPSEVREVFVEQTPIIVREPVIYRSPVVVERVYHPHTFHRHYYPSYYHRGSSIRKGF